MKNLTIFILAIVAITTANAQSWRPTFGMNYGFTLPAGGMKPYIKNGHGISMNFLAEAPSQRIAAGVEFNFTGYGRSKSEQEYTFSDGSTAPMNVIVNNYFMNLMGVTRLYLVPDGPIKPYVTFKAGYTWFDTNLAIVDPDDTDSCEPVESNMLSKDGTFSYSAGGGVTVDLSWIFRNMERGVFYVDLSSNVLQGGRVNYMNEDPPQSNGTHTTTRAKEITAEFIDTQTQVVHAHHVGYLYNSFVQMMDFRLGVQMRVFR